jgi:hypothetical protein
MADKQIQKAGDNAQQMQASTIIINNGIDEKRAREIYADMNVLAIKNYTAEAISVANARVTEFEKRLMPKMQAIDGALESFADPSFQLLLVEAQKTAAATERPVDYDLLSELLIHRFQNGNNRQTRAGISRAVEIIDEISDDALLGLTVYHSVTYFTPVTGNILQGLDVLDDLFGKIIYGLLPLETEWLDHLDVLDAVRINMFGNIKKIQQWYPEKLEGYISVGIEKESEDHKKAIEILNEAKLPIYPILVDHVLNSGYLRLNLPNKEQIDSLVLQRYIIQNGQPIQINFPLSDIQKKAIKQIYDLYKNDDVIKNGNITSLMNEWNKRLHLKTLYDWWNNIKTSFQITSVGKVLAHANAQRCDRNLPPLN